MSEKVTERLKRLSELKEKKERREGLPHLYGYKHYAWSRRFFDSKNRYNFLCAANQIGKSSVQIRRCIELAGNPDVWPKLWEKRPLQFWYLYPTKPVCTIEVTKKWIVEFLPRGKYKDHPSYGWELEKKNKEVFAIHFKSGVSVYFKTYAQDVQDLQTGSCDAIFCDEELPEDLYDELNFRLTSNSGYFHMVFTATLGQEIWRETMEESGQKERFKDALKIQVSMFDCMEYEDGSPTHFTEEKIRNIIASCKNQNEVLRRVYGRFVVDAGGLKYPAFDKSKNVKKGHHLPDDWIIYAGIDPGSGGARGHPAAIVFCAVSPDHKQGRVFRGWRGDGILTTSGDVLNKYLEMKEDLTVAFAFYDFANKDFHTIATRMGVSVLPADKSHETGEQIINVLFKNEMLAIYDYPPLEPLVHEICSLMKDTPKNRAKDDFCDAMRYAITKVPWDFSEITIKGPIPLRADPELKRLREQIDDRRGGRAQSIDDQIGFFIEEELDAWDELYEV